MTDSASNKVTLRDVRPDDLDIFFVQESDPDANYMAAFTPENPTDRAAFDAHWAKILADASVINQTIVYEGEVAGNIAHFVMFDEPFGELLAGQSLLGQGHRHTGADAV